MRMFLLLSLLTVTFYIPECYRDTEGRLHKGTGFCSGVFVAPDKILTAAHCVSQATEGWIQTNNGHKYEAALIKKNADEDLALLFVSCKPHPYAVLGTPVNITDKVYTVNSGDEYLNTYGEGIVINIVQIEELISSSVMHNIAIFGGASGSGLFDQNGRLVGINVIKRASISYAVNSKAIRKFLHENHIN